jgi:hypothetical protein
VWWSVPIADDRNATETGSPFGKDFLILIPILGSFSDNAKCGLTCQVKHWVNDAEDGTQN